MADIAISDISLVTIATVRPVVPYIALRRCSPEPCGILETLAGGKAFIGFHLEDAEQISCEIIGEGLH
ncbi:hypothetical protein Daus18300_002242 [Diaporthe australafricana]|uniref:Uncharacterized protein n=1 Tax=Diaporthe australafricana TaxID=127596 RepID=A0ABR3XQ95_9PEZI